MVKNHLMYFHLLIILTSLLKTVHCELRLKATIAKKSSLSHSKKILRKISTARKTPNNKSSKSNKESKNKAYAPKGKTASESKAKIESAPKFKKPSAPNKSSIGFKVVPFNGPCIDSDKFTFGSFKYNDNTILRDCAWIESNSKLVVARQKKFCKDIIKGSLVRDQCPQACGVCTNQGAGPPGTSPHSPMKVVPQPSPKQQTHSTPVPSNAPIHTKSLKPTSVSSISKIVTPQVKNTMSPSVKPSQSPSNNPFQSPSNNPSQVPTRHPSLLPTTYPSITPSFDTSVPSNKPLHPRSMEPTSVPSESKLVSSTMKLALGHSQSAVVLNNGSLKCWGDCFQKLNGKTGDAAIDNYLAPTIIGENVAQVAFGNSHACIILQNDDNLKCWGDNRYGQLGTNSIESSDIPLSVSLGTKIGVKQIALGSYHSCAVLKSDELKCWGWNRHGQLGDGDTSRGDSLVPKTISLGSEFGVKQVALGDIHTCAVLFNDELKCFGGNSGGQLGDNSLAGSLTPKTISVGTGVGVRSVSLGGYHSCAVLNNDVLKCWGYNNMGQLGGNLSGENYLIPKAVAIYQGTESVGVKSVSVGGFHTCAVLVNDQLYCWGDNSKGQLGVNSRIDSVVPQNVPVGENIGVKQVALGYQHSCAVLTNGKITCWGANWSGQVGDTTLKDSLQPKLLLLNPVEFVFQSFDSSDGYATQIGSSSMYAIYAMTLSVTLFFVL
jgi:alpha-tubulin suppressor-like RCC1 family protein